MYKELLDLMGNAHATYDDKCFSSIVVMKDGTTFSGVTVKNQIFRDAVYAEQASIARAVSKGYKYGDFDKIYIMVGTDHLNDLRHINRDFITEFMEPESQVWLYNKDGDHRILKVGNLLFNIY